jgi:hypothetical protein
MKSILARCGFTVALALALSCLGAASSFAQQAPPPAGQAPPGQPAGNALADPFAAMAQMQAAVAAKVKEAAALPTPRTADGHPDLSGYWVPPFDLIGLITSGAKANLNPDGSSKASLFGNESDEHKGNLAAVDARRRDTSLRPVYKPEFQAKAAANFEKAAYLDPSYHCAPQGVPRMGVPSEIVQTPKAVYLLYANLYPSVPNPYRIIPVDGRSHDEHADPMADGDAVGHWDGDTLVIDVTNIDPDTWLDGDGSFHDDNLHVTERITRRGNTLRYEVTADDPTLFQKPFSPKPVTVLLGKSGDHAPLDYPCVEMDQSHLTTTERH